MSLHKKVKPSDLNTSKEWYDVHRRHEGNIVAAVYVVMLRKYFGDTFDIWLTHDQMKKNIVEEYHLDYLDDGSLETRVNSAGATEYRVTEKFISLAMAKYSKSEG